MKKQEHLVLLLMLTLSVAIAIFVPPAYGAPDIYVYPDIIMKAPGESFTVDIKISQAMDIFAWEFALSWNASVLNLTSVEEGDFLTGHEEAPTFFVEIPDMDEMGNDTVEVANTRLGAIGGVSGLGTLAKITFLVESEGETVLHLVDTKLRDSVPNPVPHTSTDGLFTSSAGFPQASFTFSPTTANINETITFDAGESSDPDGVVVDYLWDFGDEATANLTVPITYHDYAEGGTYTVTLTVIDNEGWESSTTKDVKVIFAHELKALSVSASPDSVSPGGHVTITVEIGNEGAEDESGFDVTVYYDSTVAAPAQTVSTLNSGQNKTLTFDWDTDGVAAGLYRIEVRVDSVPGEINTANNIKSGGDVYSCRHRGFSVEA